MKKKLILGIVTSVLVLGASAGGLVLATYALFNSQTETNNHLVAGKLKAELYETKVSGLKYENNAFVPYTEGVNVDLTKDKSSIFDISGYLPGMYQESTLLLKNTGDIAFTYSISFLDIVLGEDEASSQALQEQIEITLTVGEEVETFALDEKDFSFETPVAPNSEQEFVIKAEFINDSSNNLAMNGEVSFDISVTAVQVIPE